MITRLAPLSLGLALTLAACLDDRGAHVDCGQGDAFNYAGADYCIYASAIIIEGFDCPAAVPFGQEMGDLFICSPTGMPPDGGWDVLVTNWEQEGNGGPDTWQPDTLGDSNLPETSPEVVPDTTIERSETDTTPIPTVCVDGLNPGTCWDAAQCPSGWVCEGAAPGCTPCVDCPDPIPGYAGACRPEPAVDTLGLLAWPAGAAQPDQLVALFWIQSAFYALLECPAFDLELGVGDGSFTPGPSESACSGVITPDSGTVIARNSPMPEVRTGAGVRVQGRYRTNCVAQDPAGCEGTVELTSNVVVLPP